jgi:hypothetical protein
VLCLNVLQHLDSEDWERCVDNVFCAAKGHVIFSVYGSRGETRSSHDGNFLNWWFSKDDFLALVPGGWDLNRLEVFSPPWDDSMILIQTWHTKQI